MAWDMPRDPEESPNKDTPEAEALLAVMHAHSDEWCAGWLTDQEFYLWSAVRHDGRWQKVGPCAWGKAHTLKVLAEAAGGWWIWGGPEGRTFLPLDVWERRYAARQPE